jgi:hypothetical protein
VTVENTAGTAWAQVGWDYYAYMTEPMMYCEWAGGQYLKKEYPLSHVTHRYKMAYDPVDQYWDCYLDSTVKKSYSLASANFSGGSIAEASGEAHAQHAQVGRNAANKLAFSDMQYRRKSDGGWPALNVVIISPDVPYGADEPAVGGLRVWTNSH